VTIEGVAPEIDGGRFASKGVLGAPVWVEADIFTDGHDIVHGVLMHRVLGDRAWEETPLEGLVNDRFRASFLPERLGHYEFTLEAWVERYATWLSDLKKRLSADQDLSVELLVGSAYVAAAADRASGEDAGELRDYAKRLAGRQSQETRAAVANEPELVALMAQYADRASATRYAKELKVWIDPPRAQFSAWYEFFPRSSWDGTGKHATLRDCEARLDYVAEMGFDILYLPPIHPIGATFRKGPNNTLKPKQGDPGSPWAIGSQDGGHKAIHPELGTAEDLRHLVEAARERGIDVALDIALQCSPDHPYVREHPEWFRHRPDGTIQYAENPPKKYQDIYPIEFESPEWRALWDELRDVFLHWIDLGIRVFRVDNPHTKPFRFWEWVIAEIRERRPEVIFLAEAFTRPKVMYHLAKVGYTQSYTYFAWRNTKQGLIEYLTELTREEPRHYFRPNFWPNTPDILTEDLQQGGPPMFKNRLILAATLSSNYGIYGPAFELMEHIPREPGSEEYLNSEKYEIRTWDVEQGPSLRTFITRVNAIRRAHPALQTNESLRFHEIQNENLIWYTKHSPDERNVIAVAVNLDPYVTHGGWAHLPTEALGIEPGEPYQMHDLLSDARYTWAGDWNYIELNPYQCPAHIFCVRKKVRTEDAFDYYM